MSDPALHDFRHQVRAWLEENAPAEIRGTRGAGRFDGYWGGRRKLGATDAIELWLERTAAMGYTAPTWPREYGGAGLDEERADILDQEMERLRVPPGVIGFGLAMLGPVVLEFGTEAQKRSLLPDICAGRVRWCQGYSEPNAGSDLASLGTAAVPDGDDFVISGQKIWTSHADKSDCIFCLVRTNPDVKKQHGITFLVIDMDDPRIDVRPIELISGSSPFCEVFFDEVRVPASHVIGEVDGGWAVAKSLLRHERTMIGSAMGGQLADAERELVEQAREALGDGPGPLSDPVLVDAIAHAAIDERCFQLTRQRIAQSVEAGDGPGNESSILKVCGSELKQRRWDLATRIAGPGANGWEGPGFDADELDLTRRWLRSRANTIEGGTTEIQLNIIASRVLGLWFATKGKRR